jgi:alkyl hydroperoxide reductase subunit F
MSVFDSNIKTQIEQYLALLESDVELTYSLKENDESSSTMEEMLKEFASCSSRIKLRKTELARKPSFTVSKVNETPRITFAGSPLGHEFSSLILAVLGVSGRKPKVDDNTLKRINSISKKLDFMTYVSLTCHNCPDVVQALNIMASVNPNVTNTIIDGGVFPDEIDAKNIMGVPTVYLNGKEFLIGRNTIEQILDLLGAKSEESTLSGKESYDMLIIGGGPAGASAAIYGARKGLRVGLVAERFGGQVLDTVGIENLIGNPYIEGSSLVFNLSDHIKQYKNIEIIEDKRVVKFIKGDLIDVDLSDGETLRSKTLIIATGAKWRNVNVPGEQEFKNKGVAYCPHCDAPLFKRKDVAVIGGGNSGVEAAIDLAGIVNHVTLLEFMSELKADNILQKRLYSLPNVTVLKNVATKSINGDTKVRSLTYADRSTNKEQTITLDGVFVQIGLVPSTEWIGTSLDRNKQGEIIINERGETSVPGVFAAGDCATTAYKQIVIAIGSGATAALSAFDYLVRN